MYLEKLQFHLVFFKNVLCFVFVVLAVESSKVVESQLGDFLVFLRRVLSLRALKNISTFVKWIDPLMTIISHKCSLGKTVSKQDEMTYVCHILAVYPYFPFHLLCLIVRISMFPEPPHETFGLPCFRTSVTCLFRS